MDEFSLFLIQLLDESKCFLEKAKETDREVARQAYLHASLLLAISSIEACVNSLAEELLCEKYLDHYSVLEQSLLLEKEIQFEKGAYVLGKKLKISRLLDRIEYIYVKFGKKALQSSDTWYTALKQAINTRNGLVHPKKNLVLTISQTEQALLAVLETINILFLAVYKEKFPAYNLGLNTSIEF